MTTWTNNLFGSGGPGAYNRSADGFGRQPPSDGIMRKTVTTLRCVPRFGYEHAQVRTIDLDLFDAADEQELLTALRTWFAQRGIADAVYDVSTDDKSTSINGRCIRRPFCFEKDSRIRGAGVVRSIQPAANKTVHASPERSPHLNP